MITTTINVNNQSAAEPSLATLKDFTSSLTLMSEEDQNEHRHGQSTSIEERKI